jgi:GNAT superfamily N-acetyltransferase
MEYRDHCERCRRPVAADAPAVFICSHECTWCEACSQQFRHMCPNCGGELVPRPRRVSAPSRLPESRRALARTEPERGRSPIARPGPRSSTSTAIERATESDLDELTRLFEAYRRFYRRTPDPARAKHFLRDRVKGRESVVFLARREGRAVGFTQLYPSFSSTELAPLWILNDLYVAPEVRRQGVAKELLAAAQRHARATAAASVLLETAHDNPAQHLYEAMGWEWDREFLHYEWHSSRTEAVATPAPEGLVTNRADLVGGPPRARLRAGVGPGSRRRGVKGRLRGDRYPSFRSVAG